MSAVNGYYVVPIGRSNSFHYLLGCLNGLRYANIILFNQELQSRQVWPILVACMRELVLVGLRGVGIVTRPFDLNRLMPAEGATSPFSRLQSGGGYFVL